MRLGPSCAGKAVAFLFAQNNPAASIDPDMRPERRTARADAVVDVGRDASTAEHPVRCQCLVQAHDAQRKPARRAFDCPGHRMRGPISTGRRGLRPSRATNRPGQQSKWQDGDRQRGEQHGANRLDEHRDLAHAPPRPWAGAGIVADHR